MKYYVKTRNFNCKKWVKKLLDITLYCGAQRGDDYKDGDGKYIYETNFLVIGLIVLTYYLTLMHWSGGWTYIKNEMSNESMSDYRVFYL